MSALNEWNAERKAELKGAVTEKWLLDRVEAIYKAWNRRMPEPNLTATELTCGLYQDCEEERYFSRFVLPHTIRLLDKLVTAGKLRVSNSKNASGNPCKAYAPNYFAE